MIGHFENASSFSKQRKQDYHKKLVRKTRRRALCCSQMATLQDLMRSLDGAVEGVLSNFLQQCTDEKKRRCAAEIEQILATSLKAATAFVESTSFEENEESAVQRVRRTESFRPVLLGEAVDKEVAAWHSAICGKLKLQPGAQRDPFRPRCSRNLPEPLWKKILSELQATGASVHQSPRRCVVICNLLSTVKSMFSEHRVSLSTFPQHSLTRYFVSDGVDPMAAVRVFPTFFPFRITYTYATQTVCLRWSFQSWNEYGVPQSADPDPEPDPSSEGESSDSDMDLSSEADILPLVFPCPNIVPLPLFD